MLSVRRNLIIFLLVVVLIFSLAVLSGCSSQGDGEVGEYDFTLPDLEGEEVTLSSYKGSIVLLKFWTTGCVYCVETLPYLEELQDEYPDLKVFAINIGEQEEGVKGFIESEGYTFPVLLDLDSEVAGKFRVRGVPTTALIDEEGEVVYNRAGALSREDMKELVESRL